MRSREFKDAIFEQIGRAAAALASPKRLELVDLLAQSERSVEELAAEAALGMANASRHLQVLKSARLVESRRVGQRVLYRLAAPGVVAAYRALRELAEERLAEIPRLVADYFGGADGIEPVGMDELVRRMSLGRSVVLDVRPRLEFEAGHVSGAISIPLPELERRLGEIPAEVEVIAYCRGRYCVLAEEAARLLRHRGRAAQRLADGYLEWRDAGLPVAAGAALPTSSRSSR
jgi:rhodanese-related sulfurtransferase/DNA-binding transcriptional ArsR family regulator